MTILQNLVKPYCLSLLLLTGGVLYSAGAAGQVDSLWRDGDYLRNTSAWLNSNNAAGLKHFTVDKFSSATLLFNKADGGFVNFYQSDNSYTLRASTESFQRLAKRTVFHGQVAYENFNGKNMGGSAFIDPYQNPIDIDEYADDTGGTKKLETYLLNAAVSAMLSSRWTLGGRIQYEAANYAKTKDLRHFNKLLNMDVSAGATYKINNIWEIGAAYHFTRRVESVSFSMLGNTDKQYLSLINFGSFYGISELFTDDTGYTAETEPIINTQHLPSLQIDVTINNTMRLFNEFIYGTRTGYYGERGTSNIVYTEHSGEQYAYTGTLSVHQANSLHTFRVKADYQHLNNVENVYRRETASGGNSTIVYYGHRDLSDRTITHTEAEYTAYLDVDRNTPRWTLKAGGIYNSREQTVILYPFYRTQTINHYQIRLFAQRTLTENIHQYGLSIETSYGNGGGTAKKDGTYATPSESQAAPKSRDLYLYQEYEYFTAPRIKSTVGFQYARQVKNTAPFIRVAYTATKAFDVTYLEDYAGSIGVMVGCVF